MTFKTMQEQEREAYVTGHTGVAKLLADAIDGHEVEILLEDREHELQTEIDDLKTTIMLLEDREHELQTEIDDLKATIMLLEDEARQDKREIGELNYILDGLVDRGIEW